MTSHPPTVIGQFEQRRTQWPVILGVICAVFGGFAAFGYGVLGVAGTLSQEWFVEFLDGMPGTEGMSAQFEAMAEFKWWAVGSNAVIGLMGLLLLVGGIALARRKAVSYRLLIAYALVKIVMTIPANVIGLAMNQRGMDAAMESMPAGQAQMQSFVKIMTVFGVLLGLIWAWALPIFLLYWMNRRKVRDEVRSWSEVA